MKRLASLLISAALFLAVPVAEAQVIIGGGGSGGGGSGTVTSVGCGNGILCSPSPLTVSGTVALTYTTKIITSAYTIAASDGGSALALNDASALALSIPVAGSTGFTAGTQGFALELIGVGAGTATLTPASGTINGASSATIAQNQDCNLAADPTSATNYLMLCFTNGGGGATGANPTATAGPTAVNGSATTFMRSDGAPAIQTATNSQLGLMEGDGSTISCTAGVCSASGSGGAILNWPAHCSSLPINSTTDFCSVIGIVGAASTAASNTTGVGETATINKIYITTNADAGSGSAWTFELFVNGIAEGGTCTIAAGTDSCSVTSDDVSLAPGDTVYYSVTSSGSSNPTSVTAFIGSGS